MLNRRICAARLELGDERVHLRIGLTAQLSTNESDMDLVCRSAPGASPAALKRSHQSERGTPAQRIEARELSPPFDRRPMVVARLGVGGEMNRA